MTLLADGNYPPGGGHRRPIRGMGLRTSRSPLRAIRPIRGSTGHRPASSAPQIATASLRLRRHLPRALGPARLARYGGRMDSVALDRSAALLRSEVQAARAHTDALFALVDPPTLYERPIPDRHRLIFYVGHFDAFDWNQLARGVLDLPSFHPSFDRLFEAGIDPAPGQAPADRPSDWPRLDEVRAYVARTRRALDDVWDELPAERVLTALEHRWMHAETLCYLLHQLDPALKHAPAPPPAAAERRRRPARSARSLGGDRRRRRDARPGIRRVRLGQRVSAAHGRRRRIRGRAPQGHERRVPAIRRGRRSAAALLDEARRRGGGCVACSTRRHCRSLRRCT